MTAASRTEVDVGIDMMSECALVEAVIVCSVMMKLDCGVRVNFGTTFFLKILK